MTENVRDAVNTGVFDDRVWLGQVDAVFAKLYFDSMDAWHSGDPAARAATPKAWQIALQAADDRAVTGLGNFLLAMNAHINRDFSYVLAEIGLTDADGRRTRRTTTRTTDDSTACTRRCSPRRRPASTRRSTTSTS